MTDIVNLGECDECGTPYSYDPTDGGTICVKCLRDKIAAARRTAEFWKAEHMAANEVIARLQFELAQWKDVAQRNIAELRNSAGQPEAEEGKDDLLNYAIGLGHRTKKECVK